MNKTDQFKEGYNAGERNAFKMMRDSTVELLKLLKQDNKTSPDKNAKIALLESQVETLKHLLKLGGTFNIDNKNSEQGYLEGLKEGERLTFIYLISSNKTSLQEIEKNGGSTPETWGAIWFLKSQLEKWQSILKKGGIICPK